MGVCLRGYSQGGSVAGSGNKGARTKISKGAVYNAHDVLLFHKLHITYPLFLSSYAASIHLGGDRKDSGYGQYPNPGCLLT